MAEEEVDVKGEVEVGGMVEGRGTVEGGIVVKGEVKAEITLVAVEQTGLSHQIPPVTSYWL